MIWNNPPVSLPITESELIALGIPSAAVKVGEYRGQMTLYGPWQICTAYRALCMSTVYVPKEQQRWTAQTLSETAYGMRTMTECRESGYQLEGRVSVNGKKVRAFTSSQMFELPDGKLVNVATVQACFK